jgi:tetratricopeptide (TPR) repeat protein
MSEAAQGKLEGAIAHFRRSIELGNRSGTVHYNLGLAYLRKGQRTQAIQEIKQALTIDPKLKSGLYTLAVALLEGGRADEAIPYLSDLRKESPSDPAVWANLVRAQFQKNDSTAALKTVDEAVEALASNVQLFVTLAGICSTNGQIQKALHLLENASELKPEDSDIKLLLAKVSLQAKQPIETLAVLIDVPSNYGNPGEIPYVKGVALALTGKHDEAVREFSAAVTANPQNIRYVIAQAWAYQLDGNHDQALTVLERAKALDPRSPIVPYRMAVSYLYQHKYPQAVKSCTDSLKLAERYHPAYLLTGVAELQGGNLQGAETAFRKAVSLNPDGALYHRELGVTLFKLGKLEESRRELDDALTRDPKAGEAYFWRARVFAKQGKDQEAISDLETSAALQPNNADVYSELAQLYLRVGQPAKAEQISARQKETKSSGPNEDALFLSEFADPLL